MAAPGLIAKKVGMTRVVDQDGRMIPVTLLEVQNQKVTKLLTPERDGYHALQVGYFEKREKLLTKADVGRLRKVNLTENFARFKELRLPAAVGEELQIGTTLDLSIFDGVKAVDVIGITKGRGFQGAIKRWGHAIGRMTHGSRFHRRPGSLGMRTTPGRVFKGKHQPGQMGNVQRTVLNVALVEVNKDSNLIAIKGSVPGHRDGYLMVRPSIKS
jgi:large subunit ribosomal protein L3